MEINILLAYIGIALLTGGSLVASAIAVAICGRTVIGALKKRPESFGTYMLLCALPTSQGIYGILGFFLLQGFLTPDVTLLQASALLSLGLIVGAVGIFASIGQAKICANGIEATASGHNVWARTMVMAVFPETFAIFALLVMFTVMGAI